MTKYLPGYVELRDRVGDDRKWRALKPVISVANNTLAKDFPDLTSEDLDRVQAIMARTRGDRDPIGVALTLRNRFADHANAAIAEHGLAVPPFRRASNKRDERAARLAQLPRSFVDSMETFVCTRPKQRQKVERNILQRCGLALVDAGQPFEGIEDLLTVQALPDITDAFAHEDAPSASRDVALATLSAVAGTDHNAKVGVLEARRALPKVGPQISNAALARLAPFRRKKNFRILIRSAEQAIRHAAGPMPGPHALHEAQSGLFVILSVAELMMPKDITSNIAFSGPETAMPGGGLRPTLVMASTGEGVETGWPAKLLRLVDAFYVNAMRDIGTGPSPFLRPDGSIRGYESIVSSVTDAVARWMEAKRRRARAQGNVERLRPTDLRDLGVQQLIQSKKLSPAQIAELAGYTDEQKFMLRFKPMYDNERRARD